MSEAAGMEIDLIDRKRESCVGRKKGHTVCILVSFVVAASTSSFFLLSDIPLDSESHHPSDPPSSPVLSPPFRPPSGPPVSPPPFPPPVPCDFGRAVCLGHVTLGRTGNHLLQLAIALSEAAKRGACFLFLPKRMQEDVGEDGSKQVILKFEESGWEEGAFKYVVRMEDVARPNASHVQRLVETQCGWTPFGDRLGWSDEMFEKVGDVRRLFQTVFKTEKMDGEFLKCGAGTIRSLVEDPCLGEEGVVMHMRGGDIMRMRGRRMDGFLQPPCAFYEHVMLHGRGGLPFKYGLIVTEPEMKNPCVHHISSTFPTRVKVQSSDPTQDACTIVHAKNLALAASSFSRTLSLLNPRLENLYVPFSNEDGCLHVCDSRPSSLPYNQHLYEFGGYESSGEMVGWPFTMQAAGRMVYVRLSNGSTEQK